LHLLAQVGVLGFQLRDAQAQAQGAHLVAGGCRFGGCAAPVAKALEARVLHGLERQAVLGADDVAVVAVHQDVAPQHQRIALPRAKGRDC
jgi:hypothetical protein